MTRARTPEEPDATRRMPPMPEEEAFSSSAHQRPPQPSWEDALCLRKTLLDLIRRTLQRNRIRCHLLPLLTSRLRVRSRRSTRISTSRSGSLDADLEGAWAWS